MSYASFPVVVLPTYNEKENISHILPEILKQDKRIHVLVVDDHSPDKTADAVKKIQKKYSKRVHLISRKGRGRGAAVLKGFKEALKLGATSIFEMDADFSHNPKDLPRFLKEIEKVDVVIGSRFVKGGKIEQRGWLRNVLSDILNEMIRLLLGLKIHDTSTGFRLFRSDVIKKINTKKIVSKNYSLCPELLYRATQSGFSLKEIPIVFVNRYAGKSKANLHIAIDYFLTIFRIRFSK